MEDLRYITEKCQIRKGTYLKIKYLLTQGKVDKNDKN